MLTGKRDAASPGPARSQFLNPKNFDFLHTQDNWNKTAGNRQRDKTDTNAGERKCRVRSINMIFARSSIRLQANKSSHPRRDTTQGAFALHLVMYYSMCLLAAAAFASEGLTCFNCGYANSGTYGTQGWPKVTSWIWFDWLLLLETVL